MGFSMINKTELVFFFFEFRFQKHEEFVTNVIEICQYYNFGHYQKTIEPYCTKESAL